MSERNVLLKTLNHPFLVGLHYSFQTTEKLYFVLDYVNGGEVSGDLRTVFVLYLYLHFFQVVHCSFSALLSPSERNYFLRKPISVLRCRNGLCLRLLTFQRNHLPGFETREYTFRRSRFEPLSYIMLFQNVEVDAGLKTIHYF